MVMPGTQGVWFKPILKIFRYYGRFVKDIACGTVLDFWLKLTWHHEIKYDLVCSYKNSGMGVKKKIDSQYPNACPRIRLKWCFDSCTMVQSWADLIAVVVYTYSPRRTNSYYVVWGISLSNRGLRWRTDTSSLARLHIYDVRLVFFGTPSHPCSVTHIVKILLIVTWKATQQQQHNTPPPKKKKNTNKQTNKQTSPSFKCVNIFIGCEIYLQISVCQNGHIVLFVKADMNSDIRLQGAEARFTKWKFLLAHSGTRTHELLIGRPSP